MLCNKLALASAADPASSLLYFLQFLNDKISGREAKIFFKICAHEKNQKRVLTLLSAQTEE